MKKYSVYFWALIVLLFLGFISLMSYWYPITVDEYYRWQVPFTWEMVRDIYFSIVPRISFIFGLPIFYLGKWSFVLVNPFVQLANCLCIFYIVFLRFPDTKDFKDMPYFLIVLCMSVFFVCTPSEVLFWVSGTYNYSWILFFFLLLLCFLRRIYAQKFVFSNSVLAKILFFILGFIVGMSNEPLAPVALGFTVCFALFCDYKKIKTPRTLSYLIFGLAIGCLVFFAAPAHYSKMMIDGVVGDSTASIWNKLFFHFYNFNDLFKAQFFLPVLIALLLILAFIDIRDRDYKIVNLWYSAIFWIMGFLIAFILFVVPQPPMRAYYSASVVFILSFLFLVKYYIDVYKFDFSKKLCFLIVGVSLCLLPRFVLPHYYLHLQEKARIKVLKQNPDAKVKPYVVLKGPTENLTIGLTDLANRVEVEKDTFITLFTEPVNW